MTLGDFFEDRYGSKKMASSYGVVCALVLMMLLAPCFNAMAKTVMALTPKTVEQLNDVEMAEYNNAMELQKLESRTLSSLDASQRQRLEQLRIEKPRKLFSHMNKPLLIILVCSVVLIYGIAGGLEAAFLSDMLQGVFIIILLIYINRSFFYLIYYFVFIS